MRPSTYRDMHLLDAVTQTPDVTQRELSKRIGAALGLTNLMLRRLAKKGYIKISGTKRSRIRYLITPQGLLEKSRLTYEFVQYSLQFYTRVRRALREQLALLAREGQRRIVLCGTGELAEIAFLTIREAGLEFVGIVSADAVGERFLGYPVKHPTDVLVLDYDRMLVASLNEGPKEAGRLAALGVPADRIVTLTQPAMSRAPDESQALETAPAASIPSATDYAETTLRS